MRQSTNSATSNSELPPVVVSAPHSTPTKPSAVVRPALILVALSLLSVALMVARWQIARPQPVNISLGDPQVAASHFYGVEAGEDKSFRWSRTLSALSLPALAGTQTVSIEANPARPSGGPPVKFRLLSGTTVLGEFEAQPGWHTYTATAQLGLAPDMRFLIESDAFYPSASDRRRLGLAVSTISAAPVQGRLGLTWPPYLWLIIAALAPLIGFGFGRRSVRLALACVASILVLALSLAPAAVALPLAAWMTGVAAAVLLLYLARGALAPGGLLAALLNRIAGSRWELPAVAVLTGGIAVAITWPLAARLGTSMPGWPGDNFAFLYKFWWFRTALLIDHRWPFYDPNTFAPFGFNLGQGEPTLANTLPGALLGAVFNDVAAYNLIVLLSFVVSGLGAYLLVREITGNRPAATLAAVAFAFCPYRLSQMAGHIQMLGTGWIPLSFYFAERALRTRRWQPAALSGVALGLAALSAWYYAYIAGLLLGIYLLLRLWSLRRNLNARWLLRAGLAAFVAFLLIAGPVALPSLSIWASGGLTHSAKAADEASASPLDYVIPNALQPAWGELSMRAHSGQNIIEDLLYLGLVTTAIAVAGLAFRGRRRGNEPSLVAPWLVILIISLVLSFGLTLHGLAGLVTLPATGNAPIPMPARLLYDWLPLFSSMRAYARFGLVAMLALAVLAGLAWSRLARARPSTASWLTLVAIICILIDYWAAPYPWGTTHVQPTRAATFLASAPPGTVMQMPLQSALSGPALFAEVYYRKPIAYGYDTFEPAEWRAARPSLLDFPSDASLDVLAKWGVKYIVVSANAYGADWPGTLAFLKSLPRLRHLQDFNEARSWDVDPAVLDARPDMEDALAPDTVSIFELIR
ncbi:MAG: 6-pyruvoyl-tetrahydropterin synthase-related protein [Chloroflexia bacterium]